MSSSTRHRSRRSSTSPVLPLLLLTFLVGPSCGGDGGGIIGPSSPYRLTFSLNASFQGPHGGQPIAMAVVRASDGMVVAETSGTVSATEDPAFTFDAGRVMEHGVPYEVHYWIDSNFGGGTLGVCDPKAIDHQWSTEFLSPTNDVNVTVPHQPALTEDVCDTFI